jgi:Luciferase-like monooxygenase
MPSTCGGSHAGVMNTSTPIRRGLGISAGLDAGLARDLAVRCEQLGYHSLWSNDEPASPGLEMLAHFAAAAPQLQLGVGVLPLDRHQPVRIAAEIARLGLDPARLWIGVGSGQLHAPTRRAAGCGREPTRRDAEPRSSRPMSASPWAPAQGSGTAPRSAATATSMRPIVSTSRPWTFPRQRRRGRIGATGGARRTGAIPFRARPSDRTAAHRPGCNLAACRRGCCGAVTRRSIPGSLIRARTTRGATRYRCELIGADQSARSGPLQPARSRRAQDAGLRSCWW